MRKNANTKRVCEAKSGKGSLRDVMLLQLNDLIHSVGMNALAEILEEERAAICGSRYRHRSDRHAYRAGYAKGRVVLGGRQVTVDRPRVRSVGGDEIGLPSWNRFSDRDPLDKHTVNQMMIGVSTRNYDRSLFPLPESMSESSKSKSAVSRRFVSMTTKQLTDFMSRPLSSLRLCSLMVDGIHFGDHVALIALGIDLDGKKHILGMVEGATENATACTDLLTQLVHRGLQIDTPILVVIDGAKALRKAVREVFGKRAIVQRCQVHKKRNVLDYLPEEKKALISRLLSEVYRLKDVAIAKRRLQKIAHHLEHDHPSAAASLREGLDETLTVMRLGVKGDLARILSSTNCIENLMSLIAHRCRNVRRWQGGTMMMRWVATALCESESSFHRIKGFREIPALMNALIATQLDSKENATIDQVSNAA